MDFISLLKLLVGKLESVNIPYMLVGSVASSFYGDPRLTRDIDVVVELLPTHVSNFESIFSSNDFYVPPMEVLSDEVLNKRSFNLIHHETGLKIDVVIKKLAPHSIKEFSRRQKHQILPQLEGFIASPEDVIIKKLQYFQEGGSQKHLTDCRSILNQANVDLEYIEHWIHLLNLSDEWNVLSR